MGTQNSPNIVLPLRDLSDGSLDSGKTVELIPHGDTYPTNVIALTEISATGVYKKETAVDTPAVAQGIYQVFVNTVLAGIYLHGGGFLQSHIDDVSDPHSVAGAQIGISDSGEYFATDDVEAALQELGAHMNATNDPHAIKSSQITDDASRFVRQTTATVNQDDAPPPSLRGGGTVWVEFSNPNDMNKRLLDTGLDYRDRFIIVTAYHKLITGDAGDYLPGGVNDALIQGNMNVSGGGSGDEMDICIFYSGIGQNGQYETPGGKLFYGNSTQDILIVHADSSSGGKLYITKRSLANGSKYDLILKIEYSPKQNHISF